MMPDDQQHERSRRWQLTWGLLPAVGMVSLAAALTASDQPAHDPAVFVAALVFLAGVGLIIKLDLEAFDGF